MAHRFDALDARASCRPRATTAGTPTVMLVDDDELVLRALRRLLEQAGFHVKACASLGDLLRSPHCGGPGCLVLDLHLPGLSGIELYQLLHEAGCRMPTVFLTGHGDVAASVSAMKLGAVDFLTKPVDDADLLDAVRAALARDEAARHALAERRQLERGAATLTPREAQVWSLVVTGLRNREVAARLGTREKTVKVHRARVMTKLRASSFADLVRMHLVLHSGAAVALDAASAAASAAGRGAVWPSSSAAVE